MRRSATGYGSDIRARHDARVNAPGCVKPPAVSRFGGEYARAHKKIVHGRGRGQQRGARGRLQQLVLGRVKRRKFGQLHQCRHGNVGNRVGRYEQAGNFVPVTAGPTTVQSGQTPIVVWWDYLLASEIQSVVPTFKIVIPTDAHYAAYYSQAISKTAPNLACARLWEEYLYSTTGQNLWLQGKARPIELQTLVSNGTVNKTANAALPAAPASSAAAARPPRSAPSPTSRPGCTDAPPGAVDVLVRPENLRIAAIANGNGIVTSRTFLGSVTRIHALLSGDVTVQVDVPSAAAAQLAPRASVQVSLDGSPVQVAGRS